MDVGEGARVFAVYENHRLRIFQNRRAEFRKHAGVWRTGILSRPKDVEITERDVFQSVTSAKCLAVKLANVLGDAVRRNRLRLHGFDFRQSRRLAISGRRSSE